MASKSNSRDFLKETIGNFQNFKNVVLGRPAFSNDIVGIARLNIFLSVNMARLSSMDKT